MWPIICRDELKPRSLDPRSGLDFEAPQSVGLFKFTVSVQFILERGHSSKIQIQTWSIFIFKIGGFIFGSLNQDHL